MENSGHKLWPDRHAAVWWLGHRARADINVDSHPVYLFCD